MSPELRHLRHFVAVGEELHFTRAAARLHMAQQPLSASIRRLEGELGVDLLRRTTRRVELTEAGAALLERAREAVQAADAAFDAARATGRGEAGVLTIGLSPGIRYGLGPLFDALRTRYPRLRVRMRQASSTALIEDVVAGALDAAIGVGALPAPSLLRRRLKDEPVIVVVGAEHRLGRRERVELAELRDETFALVDPREGPGYNAAVLALCRQAGFEARTQTDRADHDPWEAAILHGGCVGLTVASAVHAARRGMQPLGLHPPATLPVDLLWRPDARPALATLLDLAERAADEQGWKLVV